MMEEDIEPLIQPRPDPEHSAPLRHVRNRGLFLATLAAVLGPLSFGFVVGYSSPAIADLQKSDDPRLVLDNNMASWFGSIVTIGAAVGGLAGGWLVDRIGRKLSLILCAIPFVAGFTLIISAQNVLMLLAGRVLTGLASGVTSLVVPVYISETSHPGVRGMLGSCVQLMVVTGILGSYVAGMFLDWRWLSLLCSAPPIIMAISMIFMPETPRFLINQNKRAAALSALRFLRGPEVDPEWEYRQIVTSNQQQEGGLKLSDFKSPTIYKPFLVGVALMFLQQFSGINAIMFYADMIFKEANFQNSGLASVIVGLIQVVGTAVAALIMDKAGRKVLLLVSGSVMAVSASLFGVYFKITEASAHNSSSVLTAMAENYGEQLTWLPLASMCFFIAGFAIGWGPIPWLVMSEIFPLRARGVASGVCVVTNWGCAFLVTKEFHDMLDTFTSYGTFWAFAAFCVIGLLFTVLSVPETKGKTLEEIEAHFQGEPMAAQLLSGSIQ